MGLGEGGQHIQMDQGVSKTSFTRKNASETDSSNAKSQDTKLSRPHRHTPPHESFDYHPPSNTAASHLLSTPFPAAEPPYHHNPLVVCIQSGNKNQRLDGGPPMHVMCRLSHIISGQREPTHSKQSAAGTNRSPGPRPVAPVWWLP